LEAKLSGDSLLDSQHGGKNFWKLNTSIFLDNSFLIVIFPIENPPKFGDYAREKFH